MSLGWARVSWRNSGEGWPYHSIYKARSESGVYCTLARNPASGAAFGGIVGGVTRIAPSGHSICGGAARQFCSPPWQQSRKQVTEERAKVVASILCIDDD